MKKIRKGDSVIVITGRDKGKKGTVTGILENKFVVEGVNIYKKNVKPNPNDGTTGGTVDKTMPIAASNIALVDANGKHPVLALSWLMAKKCVI